MIWKPTLQIELTERFRRAVRSYPKAKRRAIAKAIDAVRDQFGSPGGHSGLGIRKLKGNCFECRVGLDVRLIFYVEKGVASFVSAGDHNHVRAFIKGI